MMLLYFIFQDFWHYAGILGIIMVIFQGIIGIIECCKGDDGCMTIEEQKPCEDAVIRDAVLQAVSKGCQEWRGIYGRCEELINDLPSVTVRQTGKWIEHEHNGMHYIECSQCRVWFLRYYLVRNSFCPNCGAEMRGD